MRRLRLSLIARAAPAGRGERAGRRRAEPLDGALQQARAEAGGGRSRDREARAGRRARRADEARSWLARSAQAAAAAIDAAEARISAADAQLRLAVGRCRRAARERLAAQQRRSPSLARRARDHGPAPAAARASPTSGGIDELVRVRVLLDSTLPVIRAAHRGAVRASSPKAERLERRRRRRAAELRAKPRTELARPGSSNSPRSRRRPLQARGVRRQARRRRRRGDRRRRDVERLRGRSQQRGRRCALAAELAAAIPRRRARSRPEPGRRAAAARLPAAGRRAGASRASARSTPAASARAA